MAGWKDRTWPSSLRSSRSRPSEHPMFHFVANLKPYTFHRGRGNDRFDAYLLSADYVTSLGKYAKLVVRDKRVLCADNGNVDLIRKLLGEFAPKARPLYKLVKAEEKANGRRLRPGEISRQLRDEYRSLAKLIRTRSAALVDDEYIRMTTGKQNAMGATYLVGMEDFTIAAMTGLSMNPQYTGLGKGFIKPLAKRAIDFALEQQEEKHGPCPATVFSGMHAIDYDSAVIVGQLAGDAGCEGIASGLVGALRDKSYRDYRIVDGKLIELPSSMPSAYVRTLEIAAGLHVGYARGANKMLRFHALGAGSPILLPLLALLGDKKTYTCADSTAPIVDGMTSSTLSLYVDTPALLKYKTFKIANYWLGGSRGWDCTCPYCRGFNAAHPPEMKAARAFWRSQGQPKLSSKSMHSSSPYAKWFPLLGRHPELEVRRAAGLARVGHNHWVVMRIESEIRRNSKTRASLRKWVESEVRAYAASPGASSKWKAATQIAWRIADQAHEEMRGIASSPLG